MKITRRWFTFSSLAALFLGRRPIPLPARRIRYLWREFNRVEDGVPVFDPPYELEGENITACWDPFTNERFYIWKWTTEQRRWMDQSITISDLRITCLDHMILNGDSSLGSYLEVELI